MGDRFVIDIDFSVVKSLVWSRSIISIGNVSAGRSVMVGVFLRRFSTRLVLVWSCLSSALACNFVMSNWKRSFRLVFDIHMAGSSAVHAFVVKVVVDIVYVPQLSFVVSAFRVIVVDELLIFVGSVLRECSNLGCCNLFSSSGCQIVSKVVGVALFSKISLNS